jgi:hypothetical protein
MCMMLLPFLSVPDSNPGSCLDLGLHGTGLELRTGQGEGEAETRPGPPNGGGGQQLEPSRDGGNMSEDYEKTIRDMTNQGQRPKE